jgi:iron complex outermembrane receptor protein
MKRLLLVILFSAYLCGLRAQSDTIRLNDVEISADRVPMLYSSSIRPMQVITLSSLQSMPVNDLTQLLTQIAGFDIRKRGAGDIQADLSIRGGSFEQTLIMLNGLRMNDPQTGHHNMDLPVELDQANRIELMSGAGARIYGTNASAGAVNLITEASGENSLQLNLQAGDFGTFGMSAAGNLKTGKAKHFISGVARTCDGYTANTDFYELKAFYHGIYPLAKNRLELMTGYMNKGFGANSFYSAKYPDQYERTRMEMVALKGSFGKKLQWHPAVYWKRHHDRFELFRDEAPSWYTNHNYHMTDVIGIELNANFNSILGKTSVGADYRYEHIYSNVLGELMRDTLIAPGETSGFFTRSSDRPLISMFIDQQYSFKRLALAGGVLMQYTNTTGAGWYPGLDVAFRIAGNLRIFASVSRSLRLPTYTDLYYKGPSNVGNPDLKPEQSWEAESGLRFENKAIQTSLTGFYRKSNNTIDWIRLSGEIVWHTQNLTQLITAGAEVKFACNLPALAKRKIFIHNINFAWQWISMSKPSTDVISYYVLDYLKHKITLGFDHIIWKNIGAGWTAAYYDRAGSYTDPANGGECVYQPYVLLNGKIYWKSGPVGLSISVNNFGNVQYRDISSVEMPGRWVMGGLSIVIK